MHVPIKLAAQRSGLTPQRIRMWEKRHGLLAGPRPAGDRRQFSPAEVEHLTLLRAATEQGHRIGDLAGLTPAELRRLLAAASVPQPDEPAVTASRQTASALDRALNAIVALDQQALRHVIEQEHRERGHQGMLQGLVAPLLEEIGARWVAGTLRTLHEHFATATLRTVLLDHARPFAPEADAPVLISTTPAGQLHEMGAVLAAAAAANQGWRALYLGTNLPAVEIAASARQTGARLVALSVIHPADDPRLPAELHSLRDELPDTTRIVVGGRGVAGYAATLDRIGAHTVGSLDAFIALLQRARNGTT